VEAPSLYARRLRAPFLYVVTLVCALPGALIALPIFVLGAIHHGSLRRAFFTQDRVGRDGRRFLIYKFRTMKDTGSGVECTTRFGRFLRNTHFDELPQLLNALRGDMCLIGPRPEMVAIDSWARRCIPGYERRLVIRPGLTGYAQVTQGYAAEGDIEAYTRKLALDEAYLREMSLAFDLRVICGTVLWMALRRGWR
jgi:lipopolysaccharide/colanic/teichoic acid biosynthesis glycosyltransferase